MGNTQSARRKQEIKSVLPRSGEPSEGQKQIDTINVLFLHKSNGAQLKVVNKFRDALVAKTEGTIHVTNFVNVANTTYIPRSLAWLDEFNNVVLLCLTPEAIEDFERIIREKQFADENGHLHEKVFSVTFGESLASLWPPKGMKKGSTDLRDFHFGFLDLMKIRPHDFERSLRMNSLVAAIKSTR